MSDLWSQEQCCVCGAIDCFEATDHLKITIRELTALINRNKKNLAEIDSLKKEVSDTYSRILKTFQGKL